MVIQHAYSNSLHNVSPSNELLKAAAQPVIARRPVNVVSWDPSRPWRGPAAQQSQEGAVMYSQGSLAGLFCALLKCCLMCNVFIVLDKRCSVCYPFSALMELSLTMLEALAYCQISL